MKYAKLFLVLSIIMAVAIAPVSGAFAQTDAEVAYGLAWAHAEDDFETIQL